MPSTAPAPVVAEPAYVHVGCSDLSESVEFAQRVVGLQLEDRTDGMAYLRADERDHVLILHDSSMGAAGECVVGYEAGADLETVARRLTEHGIGHRALDPEECEVRRVVDGLRVSCPDGHQLEVVAEPAVVSDPPEAPARHGIAAFEHVGLDVVDMEASVAFWTGVLGFKVSDWIGRKACLLRTDEIHHRLALFERPEAGLNHINFQVETLDDVMRQWRRCERGGVPIDLGPGRHPTSGAIFLYFVGPDDLVYEYSYGVDRLEDEANWKPRRFALANSSIDMWGGPPPRSLQSL